MKKTQTKLLSGLTVMILGLPSAASWAQVPYDPPTAQRAAPNVLLVMDATRTTLINGSTCRGECHFEDAAFNAAGSVRSPPEIGEYSDLFNTGQTRLQLARRVLTGGWGWNTANTAADASVSRLGIMDQYFVRWGVIYYDGLGARLAQNPTMNNALAQQRVIDFNLPGYGEALGRVSPTLNSFLPYYRTTRCCGNHSQGTLTPDYVNPPAGWDRAPWVSASTPFYDEATNASGRMTAALQFTRDYIGNTGGFSNWVPTGPSSLASFGNPAEPAFSNFFRGDIANVLANAPPAGCRRNFVILLTDGHGEGNSDGESRGQVAAQIHNMTRNDGSSLPAHLANQLFTVHFGVQNSGEAGTVADCGYDGVCGNGPAAFEGAPGGAITDLTPMYAAFSAIFQLVLSGTYLASPPTITRSGDRIVTSSFIIQDCQGALPTQCNIGRIGNLTMQEVLYTPGQPNGFVDDTVSFSSILRSTAWDNRNVFTSVSAGAGNCGRAASCGSQTAQWTPVLPNTYPGNNVPISPSGALTDAEFIRGAPGALFANGVARSNTANGAGGPFIGRDPYKLMDIANSQPVIVGAPTGIGEDIERWNAFLELPLSRDMQILPANAAGWIQKRGGYPAAGMTVANRDQVVYIGGNDGLLHAFLSGTASGAPLPGRTVNYPLTGGVVCGSAPAMLSPPQNPVAGCVGMELWAYSPQLVLPFWNSIRSGHYFMVDGTPVVSDVLFTKNTNNPGATCTSLHSGTCANRWEYRTVLLQCLGGGGSGCFALDVTNPYRPELLWERALTVGGTQRGTSTSRPQIARVRRVRSGNVIPYYVGIMGGGLGESNGTNRQGTVVAVGLEDGDWYASFGTELGSADFAGAPTCLDADADSFTDTCYIATTDASIYKIKLGTFNSGNLGTSSQITMERFFDGRQRLLSAGYTPAVANAIRSYGRVVATFDANRDIRIFFGTGNFEDMQNSTETNFFFEVNDVNPEAGLTAWTPALNTARAGGACNAGPNAGIVPLPTGEKSVFDPVISNGVVVFTTYRPNVNPCLPGNGYLNGLTVDACTNGIDSDGNGTPDSGVPGGTRQSYTGLPVAPVINERTGGIMVATDSGGAQANQGFTRRLPAPPVNKLWWRLVR